jgi:hypothetical protein
MTVKIATRSLLVLPFLLAMFGCKAEAYVQTSLGEIYFKGEVPLDGHEGTPPGSSMGRGTVRLEDGSEFSGEFFDADNNGTPDHFKPDAGQTGTAGGTSVTTTGNEYFDFKPA